MTYKNGDFLTIAQISEAFGYGTAYLHAITGATNRHMDGNLFRLRVETDETYRDIFNTRSAYVYPYEGLKGWYRERQMTGWVIGAAKRGQ